MSRRPTLDDLARRLAEPMPRSRAVRLIGAALVAATVPGTSPRVGRATTLALTCPPNEGLLCCRSSKPGDKNFEEFISDICPYPGVLWDCQGPDDDQRCVSRCAEVAKATGKRVQPTWSSDRNSAGDPARFDCCEEPFIGFDGECVVNCDLMDPTGKTVQCGKSCCPDGCCNRIFTLKEAHCCGEEEADKEPWKDAEVASMIALVALGAVAAVATLATGGLAAIALAGLAAGVGLGGVAAKIVGDDPPDPRYKELFLPRVPRVATVRPGAGVSPAAARALNSLIANRLRSGAYVLAYIRSIEKAQGAEKAGDKTWSKRQRKAAAGYAREAARTLGRDRSLSITALRELKRGGFVDTAVTRDQARAWQSRVRLRGLPAEMVKVLRAAGVDEPRLAAFGAAVAHLDLKLVTGVGAFGSLSDRRLAAADAATIKALRKAARA